MNKIVSNSNKKITNKLKILIYNFINLKNLFLILNFK